MSSYCLTANCHTSLLLFARVICVCVEDRYHTTTHKQLQRSVQPKQKYNFIFPSWSFTQKLSHKQQIHKKKNPYLVKTLHKISYVTHVFYHLCLSFTQAIHPSVLGAWCTPNSRKHFGRRTTSKRHNMWPARIGFPNVQFLEDIC